METFNSFDQNRVKPNNNMPLSIVGTVLGCCTFNPITFIVGIVAIVFSSQVNKKFDAGDFEGAEKSAKNAKILAYVALGLFVVGLIYSALTYDQSKIDDAMRQLQELQGK